MSKLRNVVHIPFLPCVPHFLGIWLLPLLSLSQVVRASYLPYQVFSPDLTLLYSSVAFDLCKSCILRFLLTSHSPTSPSSLTASHTHSSSSIHFWSAGTHPAAFFSSLHLFYSLHDLKQFLVLWLSQLWTFNSCICLSSFALSTLNSLGSKSVF